MACLVVTVTVLGAAAISSAQDQPPGTDDFSVPEPMAVDVVGAHTSSATISGDGRFVAAAQGTSDGNGHVQIDLMLHNRVNGTSQVIAYDVPNSSARIDISADGSMVSFVSGDDMFTWSAAQGLVRRARSSLGTLFPRLSADARFLVFDIDASFEVDGVVTDLPLDGGYEVFQMELATNQVQALQAPGGPASARNLSISTDGQLVVLRGYAPPPATYSSLYLHDVAANTATLIAEDPGIGRAEITSDGSAVYFQASPSLAGATGSRPSLYRYDVGSGEITLQLSGLALYNSLMVGADGRYLAVEVEAGGATGRAENTVIIDMLLDRTIGVPVRYTGSLSGEFQFHPLEITDDGSHILMWVGRCQGAGSCSTVTRNLVVTTGLPPTAELAWRPDQTPLRDEVRRLYRAAFGRDADASGLAYWELQRARGLSRSAMASGFLGSDESSTLYGVDTDDAKFVERLYRNVLDRDPDLDGGLFWRGQLATGVSRPSLLVEFSESTENVNRTATSQPQSATAGELLRLYRAVFGRYADRDGFRYWMAVRDAGTSLRKVANVFAASSEFRQRYGAAPGPDALVTAMYDNVLGRSPDAAGRDYWLRRLNDGLDMVDLLLAFTHSSENIVGTSTQP